MTSYRIEIKQCSYCDEKSSLLKCESGNTFGAQAYTDGCAVGPMYDSGSALMTCPGCGRHQWREDVPTLKSMSESEFDAFDPSDYQGKTERGYNRHIDLSIYMKSPRNFQTHHYEDAMHQELWKTEAQEKYIRIRAWWSFNNTYREKTTEEFNLTLEQEANLLKLLQLLNINDTNESIMKAEVFRELGQFDQCLKQLDLLIDRLNRLQLICPNDFEGLREKAETLKELGQYEECCSYLFNRPSLQNVTTIKRLANCKKRQMEVIK